MRLIRFLKQDLAHEVEEWVTDDVITDEQAQAICNRYGTPYPPEDKSARGYQLLLLLGVLFISLALIVIVGENWDQLPRGLRMGALIALTVALQITAVWKYSNGNHQATVYIALLANFSYGTSIILIAQIYHLGEHMPDGIFWWALGCLPWALLLKSPLLMAQSLILAGIWFLLETDYGIYPVSSILFLLAGYWLLAVGPRSLVLLVILILFSVTWIEFSLMALWRSGVYLDGHIEQLVVTISVFILLFITGRWLQHSKGIDETDYGALIDLWCLRFGLLFLWVMSFKDSGIEVSAAQWANVPSMLIIVMVLLVFSFGIAWRIGLILQVVTIHGLVLAYFALLALGDASYSVLLASWLLNIGLLLSGIYLIYNAIKSGKTHYFFLGLITLLATAFARYFDLAGGYIGGALLFLVFAVILLGAAKYWQIQSKNKSQTQAHANE